MTSVDLGLQCTIWMTYDDGTRLLGTIQISAEAGLFPSRTFLCPNILHFTTPPPTHRPVPKLNQHRPTVLTGDARDTPRVKFLIFFPTYTPFTP